MKEKAKSISEIKENLESPNAEEAHKFKDMTILLSELKKAIEPYAVDIKVKNTNKTLSNRFYQEHFLMSAILEAFIFKNEITFKELNQSIVDYIPKSFEWDITIHLQNMTILKMARFKLIEVILTEDKNNPRFKITDKGVEALNDQTFQCLASTSFFNYQTFRLNKRVGLISIAMLIVTILSAITAALPYLTK